MSSDQTEGQTLKNRADALRGLATSGVLVEARTAARVQERVGRTQLEPVDNSRMGTFSPTPVVPAQQEEQPGTAARGQELSKPGTQVGLPAAGFAQGATKTVQQEQAIPQQKEVQPPAAAQASPKLAKGQAELDQIKRDMQARGQDGDSKSAERAPAPKAVKREDGLQR